MNRTPISTPGSRNSVPSSRKNRSGLYSTKIRMIVTTDFSTYDGRLRMRREGRVARFTRTGTDETGRFLAPGLDQRLERVRVLAEHVHLQRGLAVDRPKSARRVRHGSVADELHHRAASRCNTRLIHEKSCISVIGRSPTTIIARPSRIGRTRSGRHAASYWLSASVLTITSAPRRQRMPATPAAERTRKALVVGQPHDVIDSARAREIDGAIAARRRRSRSHSTRSKPATWRGSAANVDPIVSCSL